MTNTTHSQKNDQFEIKPHQQSPHLYEITLSKAVITQFLQVVKEEQISVERLEYTPYERQIIADHLQNIAQHNFGAIIRAIVRDRKTGGFTLGLAGVSEDTDEFVIFSTAIAHIVGVSNFDDMTGKYYARFVVKDTDNSDSYLRQAYRLFTLHTDGTFVNEPTDWLLMMKMDEQNSVGGESRLLHLDDWAELKDYYHHPLSARPFHYIAPPSKNISQEVKRPTFFSHSNRPCICYIDQFVHPETIEEARYLKGLSDSMEADKNVVELELPVGNLVVINNLFWLHGRAAFEKNPNLSRELLRQRGRFND